MRTQVKTEEEWHNLRRNCITASEAAVLVGLNPYSSPSKLKNDSFKGNAFTLVGQMLEPVVVNVANKVLDKTFKLFEDVNGKVFYVKGNLGATPDATDGEELMECKTTRPITYLKYYIEPPMTYLIQQQVQMHCTDKLVNYLAIMSTDLTQQQTEIKWPVVIYKTSYSSAICDILQEEAERFFKSKEEKVNFRIKSAFKKKVEVILQTCYTRVYS